MFLLNVTDVVLGGDEDPLPVDGRVHRMPHPAPGWMGPHGAPGFANWVNENTSVNNGNVDDNVEAPIEEDAGTAQEGTADSNAHQSDVQSEGRVLAGANAISDALIPIPLQVALPKADTVIVKAPKDDAPTMIGQVKPLVPYSDHSDSEVEEISGPLRKATPGKRRARKMKEPLYADFHRHSRRLNPNVGGFRNKESQAAAENFPRVYTGTAADDTTAPALHLISSVVEGIVVQFLKMPPGVASATSLEVLDD
ncbi:unnamed protein product [Urochloa decumbens]|uniref:Uncharacterized protein n=1 Tax=Urochloa decumbens TaxID=240449 RepID=A0ABC8VXV5_9POAL